jgi:hypothetical protein
VLIRVMGRTSYTPHGLEDCSFSDMLGYSSRDMSRFEQQKDLYAGVAPGSYEVPTMTQELEKRKKLSSRVAVFGSTTKVRRQLSSSLHDARVL